MADAIVLIDAYSQIFRSFYAIRYLSDASGRPVNALYIFTKLLLELQERYPTRRGAMLFDCGKVEFRLKLNPEYKANRPPMPEDLKAQMPRIKEMAAAFGWNQYAVPGFEADDLIGAIAASCPEREIRIVSSDKDLSQLVTEKVKLVSPAGGNKGGFEERGIAEVLGKFNVPPEKIVDFLALVGDSVDNIAGIPGIGPKGAAEFIKVCGGISAYLSDPAVAAGSKFEKKLAGQEELLRRNLELVRLRRDLPPELADLDSALARSEVDWEKVRALCEEAGFRSILKLLPAAAAEAEADLFAPPPAPAPPKLEQGELF